MADTYALSRAAYERLREEVEDLTTRGRVESARKVETARELGDLSENGDYHAAKEEQGKMEGRIRHIQALLEKAEIVEAEAAGGVVAAGSIVEIRYEGDSSTDRYLIGSIEERADVDVISPGSPLGQALVGAKVGDTVSFEAPNGNTLRVEVVAVE